MFCCGIVQGWGEKRYGSGLENRLFLNEPKAVHFFAGKRYHFKPENPTETLPIPLSES